MNDERKFIEDVWQKVEERERNVEILNALERKNESNMLLVAKEFLSGIGMKGLLYGIADVIAVSMVISICIFAGIYIYLGFDSQYVYSMIFIFSPTLYTSIFCLSYVKEIQTNTFNVQMSCRYTFFHVLVFRMLLNSGLAIVFNLIYIFTLSSQFNISPLKALALSFSSLMLFSVLLLKTLGRRNKISAFTGMNAVWFGANLLVFHGMKDLYMRFIDQIPLSVLVFAALIFVAFYYTELKKMLSMNYKRRYINA